VICLALALAGLSVPASAAGSGPAATNGLAALTATPTVDRLAAPPTAVNPNQADEGAQLYWLNCQPCHGDRGQGLTDEWRAEYPPEDQNCWESGCHGARPYENGFRLPTAVPAVIGGGSLGRFATVADLHAYVSAAMPFNNPGGLKPEEYWAITAFLARAHGLPERALPLDEAGARRWTVAGAPAATPTGSPVGAPTPAAPPPTPAPAPATALAAPALAAAGLAVLLAGALAVRLRRRSSS
jgi:cytochrome c